MKEIITKSAEETKTLAKKLAGGLTGGEVVLLYGDLGAGKTTFVQGLAEGLGIKDKVLSPTFVLRRFYGGKINLMHYDFYRLESEKDLENLDLDEDLSGNNVVVIEWPERIGFERDGARCVYFEDKGDEERLVKIDL